MSGLDVVQRLKNGEFFRDLIARTDRVVTSLLASRGVNVCPKPEQRSKAIKCSLWGMISVTQQELAIIDSPVFQRLSADPSARALLHDLSDRWLLPL